MTGLRSREKLNKELPIGEILTHPAIRIIKAHEAFILWPEFEFKLNAMELILNMNNMYAIRLMMHKSLLVSIPDDDIVDWVWLERKS